MGKYFADIHEGPDSQMGNKPETVKDTEEIIAIKRNLESLVDPNERYDALLPLSTALIFQLRYKSALKFLDQAVELLPSRPEALRMRAIRRLYTLDTKGSLEDFFKLRAMDYEDVSYQIGLGYFFSAQYEKSMKEMEICYDLANKEMKIAAMYWQAIAARRCGGKATLLEKFTDDYDCGHHTSYKAGCSLLVGHTTVEELKNLADKEESDLEYAMLSYPLHEVGVKPLEDIVKRDSFWIGFAYVAAWNDLHYEGRGRS